MKRVVFGVFLIAVIIMPMFFFAGCQKKEQYNHYLLTCAFDEESKTLACSQEVDYVNNSDNMLSEVRFHLYPNAFREGAKAKVVSTVNYARAYYNGQSYGKIDQIDVKTSEQVSGFEVGGEDQNILNVSLCQGLYPDERVTIEMSYVVTLPNINHRFGYGQNTFNFGNFYPIACVYENGKGFAQDLYHSNGDPFYSDCANYDVNLTFAEDFTLASSGSVTQTATQEGLNSVTISAPKVRDFAFVLSKNFQVFSQNVDGVKVNLFDYGDVDSQKSLEVALKAVKTFDDLFGKYPYSQLNVVKANFVHGGMEYPNLVLISDDLADSEEEQYVIVHEIAHQWWYGVVGNNEYVGAWQDEGLTDFSTLLFYEHNEEYGLNYEQMVNSASASYKLFEQIYSRYYENLDTSMNRRLDQFATEPEYTNCTYTKGVLMFDTLRQTIGEKKLLKCLKNYYKDFAFRNAMQEDLISSFCASSGIDLESFFACWLEGNVVIL